MPQPELFKRQALSVSELTDDIKLLLEGNFLDIRVEAEVSNASTSRSGHTFFTLKDETAQLSCVIWRSTAQRRGITLTDGQQIVAGGDIEVYSPHGKYQLIVRSVEQAGVGALRAAFEKLKKQLEEEGLFDDGHKKPLPKFPERIGVVTSATGAAFHDIRDTLENRWPLAAITFHHASVQGVKAAPELVKAINWFSKKQHVDVLIVGRGGGSLEDLWPFNEEAVVRALFECKVPTVSAVGHEVDFSISDFVADARAATPTQAPVLAAPDINELRLFTDNLAARLTDFVANRITGHKEKIDRLLKAYGLQAVKERITRAGENVKSLQERLSHQRTLTIMHKKEKLSNLLHQLEQKNPSAPLKNGFVRVEQGEKWVKRAKKFDRGDSFEMVWNDNKVVVNK